MLVMNFTTPSPAPAGVCVRIHAGRHKGHVDLWAMQQQIHVWNALLNGPAAFAVV